MNEQAKIDEARHFLTQFPTLADEYDKFVFTLSAFLSAARSALQYAREEAKHKPGGQVWYNCQVGGNSVVSFLKDARDLNIHVKPVSPNARLSVYTTDHTSPCELVLIATVHADGTMETQELSSRPSSDHVEAALRREYFFQEWSGSEDVIELCEIYLAATEMIVADGVAKGFLTA